MFLYFPTFCLCGWSYFWSVTFKHDLKLNVEWHWVVLAQYCPERYATPLHSSSGRLMDCSVMVLWYTECIKYHIHILFYSHLKKKMPFKSLGSVSFLNIFEISLFCSPRLHFWWIKYSKSNNSEKYYYNLCLWYILEDSMMNINVTQHSFMYLLFILL